jgi:hypothetical protein
MPLRRGKQKHILQGEKVLDEQAGLGETILQNPRSEIDWRRCTLKRPTF